MATALQCWVYHRGIFMFMLYMHSSQLSRSHGFTAVPTTVSLCMQYGERERETVGGPE